MGGTGVALPNGARQDMTDLQKSPDDETPRWNDANKDREFWANFAEGAFIGAGVAALATVGYVLLVGSDGEGQKDTAGRTGVDVHVSAEQSTIVLTQRW